MTYGIRITGLAEVKRLLGADIKPALKAATKAIALEVQGEIAPYPPSTTANSPSEKRWYERGYGPRWRRKDGTVNGRKTSQTLGRRWGIKVTGQTGHILGNAASYSKYVHSEEKQAKFHGARGWVTDKAALQNAIKSGAIKRIVTQAIMARLRGRLG